MSEEDNIKKYHGTPEIVAKIAEESDNPSVREKWEELNTLVHLIHKDKVIKKKQQANDLSKTWDEIEHRMRLVKNATKGQGIDFENYDEDKNFLSSGGYPNVTYSFANDDGTYEDPSSSNQLSITFPEKEEDKNQLSLPFPEDTEKYIEEHTLSTPLSEYEAIEKLYEDD